MDYTRTLDYSAPPPSFDDFDLLEESIAPADQSDNNSFVNCDPMTTNLGFSAGEINLAPEDQEETNDEARAVAAFSNDEENVVGTHEGHLRSNVTASSVSSAGSASSSGPTRQKRRLLGRRAACNSDDGPEERPTLQVLVKRLIGLTSVNQNTNILCAQILNHPDVMTQHEVLPLYQSYNGKQWSFLVLHLLAVS